jgi:dTDP-glucose 4,6-dehydratase
VTFQPSCVLVTGGAGFIGSNFIRWVLGKAHRLSVVNLDLLTYAGNLESLEDVAEAHGARGDGRYYFIRGDVRDFDLLTEVLRGDGRETASEESLGRSIPAPDCVLHMAAESHVDRSIMGPAVFVDTNVRGTLTLLEACRGELAVRSRPFRFLQVSTDEVYGTLAPEDPAFTEAIPLAPNSPYSASKASADLLVRSYVETFEFPAIITRCSNNYGPYQFPEKLIPLMITRALADQPLPVYGDGLNIRDWLHVEDHASALWAVLTCGRLGDVYNIGGGTELPNIEVVRALLRVLGKPELLIQYVTDRPGHDRRYAMNTEKLCRELAWQPRHAFETGLALTAKWYLAHKCWWERVVSEAYRATNALYLKGD